RRLRPARLHADHALTGARLHLTTATSVHSCGENDMNEIELEIDVMQTVGQALAQLSDPEAKRRVLAWMIDRFQPVGDPRSTPLPQSNASVSRGAPTIVDGASDTNLGVDGLAEFFDSPGATPV